MATRYLRAVNKTIRARGLDKSPAHAAIVMLVQDVARQMDAAGPDGPSGRLQERYRGALRQLGTVPVPKAPIETTEGSDEPKLNALEEFRRRHKVGPPYDGSEN